MGPDAMFLIFGMLNLRPAFALSYLTLIKRCFSSSSLSAIRVVSSAYLRLLLFLLGILIPACDSSSLEFHMMYSAYKLNKQGDNIQSCQQVSQETSQVVWYSYLFKNFPQLTVIHTVKGFNIITEAQKQILDSLQEKLFFRNVGNKLADLLFLLDTNDYKVAFLNKIIVFFRFK